MGLGKYLFPVNVLSKQKRTICRGMRKPHKLKMRLYAAFLIDINTYLDVFTGVKANAEICETELNEILFNSMPNSWRNQAYMQGFYC